MDIESRVRTLLVPVFGATSIDEIHPSQSLVADLGAESLDFVEIVYLIEKEFGIRLETSEIVTGGSDNAIEKMFIEGRLTIEGVAIIRERLPSVPERFTEGMSKMNLFQAITVGDLVHIICLKSGDGDA